MKRLESVQVVNNIVLRETELYELLILRHEYTGDSLSLNVPADDKIKCLLESDANNRVEESSKTTMTYIYIYIYMCEGS